MSGFLRQSTGSQSRLIGPYISSTDFITAMTALTIANTDIKLRANGTTLANKNSGGGTHQVNGMYSVTFDATDTATVGELAYSVVVADAMQVFGAYTVVEEVVYDALYAAAAPGYVATQVVASVTGAVGSVTGNVGGNMVGSVAGSVGSVTGAVGSVTGAVGSVTGAVGSVGANGISATSIATGTITAAKFAAGAIDANAIATDAITAAKIAADAIGASELAADAVSEIATAVTGGAAAADITVIGYFGDLNPGGTIDIKFTSKLAGVLTTLAGSPTVTVYKDNALVQSATGTTLTVDFDGVAGLHNLRVAFVADGTFYSEGSNFTAVLATGTVGGTTVVGRPVGAFSLRARASLYPTTAGHTLDVAADGSVAATGSSLTAGEIADVVQTRTIAAVTNVVNKTGFELSATGVTAVVSSVWGATTRSLTTFGTLVTDLASQLGGAFASVGLTVLDALVEGTHTVRHSLRLANAANAGDTNGMSGTTARLRDLADTKDRIVATVDTDGNRSVITRDVT